MKVSVVGCGYLGAVHAVAMVQLGHEVVGIDTDDSKISLLRQGKAPFFEPGLTDLLKSATASGRLTFSTSFEETRSASVHFLAVGTPQDAVSHAADLRYVWAAFESLVPHLKPGDLVVGKSTVPVGTAARLSEHLAGSERRASLVWNPEFLREGFAVQDTLRPDRLVYGVSRDADGTLDSRSVMILDEVYAEIVAVDTPRVVTDLATAELTKSAANAFLATKISFINAMAEIAEAAGADVTQLADAIGYDNRIGRRFLNAGVGFGGGCLPKDIRALIARAEELDRGDSVRFLREVDAINLRRREHIVDLVVKALAGNLEAKNIAVLGLAFKPHSDDVRDSPALDVAVRLFELGAKVVATDPEAIRNARRLHPQLNYVAGPTEALIDADAVVIVTEWPEYRRLDPYDSAGLVRNSIIVDGRNCIDSAAWRAAGWCYNGLGKP